MGIPLHKSIDKLALSYWDLIVLETWSVYGLFMHGHQSYVHFVISGFMAIRLWSTSGMGSFHELFHHIAPQLIAINE